MTTSSTSPAAASPTPVLRMRDPGELLAALPFLMGFRPRDSLVLVAFGGGSGRRVGLTQRIDLPAPEHVPQVCASLARNVLTSGGTGAAVLVLGGDARAGGAVAYGAGPPLAEVADAAAAALRERGLPTRMRAWAASTEPGAAWACYDECGCHGALPDAGATPLAATAVAAGLMVHADREALAALVARAPTERLARRERMLAHAVDGALAEADAAAPESTPSGQAAVDAALADALAGRLQLDDARVVALALALSDVAIRDSALARCARPGAEAAEQLWAALARETPDPEAAEPAALLAACALLRGDGALAGIALDRAERAWPGHRLTALLRAAWAGGIRPAQMRECFRPAPLPRAARRGASGRRRRAGRRGRR
jgi:hypothetical protein